MLWEASYDELPGFAMTAVAGHAGKVIFGKLGEVPVLVCSGRAHYYEGHEIGRVTFAVRALAACGVKDLVLTNAAGGINLKYLPGEFMLLADHINFTGVNPLRGMPAENGRCFVDLSDTYSKRLGGYFKRAADTMGMRLHEGTYSSRCRPSYETPAEIRAFRSWGADAVGMSTVAEAIVGRYCGLEVAGLSCITNAASGMTDSKLSHTEVVRAGEASGEKACKLLEGFALEYENGRKMSRKGKRC